LSMGCMYLLQGWTVGNIEIHDSVFHAELRGIGQRLGQSCVALYSQNCRAEFGDSECGVDLSGYTETGSVTSVTDNRTFVDSSRNETEDVFRFGLLTWTGSGDNADLAMEVKSYDPDTKTFTLMEPMAYDIAVDDEYEVTYGCDHTLDTCVMRYDNAINFRGEPWVPGETRLPVRKFPKRYRGLWSRGVGSPR